MEFCNNDFEKLLGSLMRQKNLEENLSRVIRNMEKEFQFQSLGIFLKVPKTDIYRLKIGRNISHTYEKMASFSDNDDLIQELSKLSLLKFDENSEYKFEKNYNQLLIQPLFNNLQLLGFIFMDSTHYSFTPKDEVKLNIFASLVSIIVSMNNLRYEVEQLSEIDDLTKFYTYKAFYERSETIFSQMRRYERDLTLVLMKLDNYDNIIRTIGKDNAKDLLRHISDILKNELRGSDILGKISQDTFALFLPETDCIMTSKVIDRIDTIINRLPLMTGYKVNWGIQGLSNNTNNVKDMMKLASEALFESSRQLR